uniref:Uncharacterized protein n=1 Tax=Timema poppense TaxID=170557 RepID=A0A7R9HA62_TIMPO|nr:unnamed protein product [Timema poppensis]
MASLVLTDSSQLTSDGQHLATSNENLPAGQKGTHLPKMWTQPTVTPSVPAHVSINMGAEDPQLPNCPLCDIVQSLYLTDPASMPPRALTLQDAMKDFRRIIFYGLSTFLVCKYRKHPAVNRVCGCYFGTPSRDSNLNLPVIGSLVYCKSSALDHAAIETQWSRVQYLALPKYICEAVDIELGQTRPREDN